MGVRSYERTPIGLEPGIVDLAKRDLLDPRAVEVAPVLAGPKVGALLTGQQPDGGFGTHVHIGDPSSNVKQT